MTARLEALFARGTAARERGERQQALRAFEQCQRAALKAGDATWQVTALRAVGELRLREKQVSAAIAAFASALEFSRAAGDEAAMLLTLPRLARALCDQGRVRECRDLLCQASTLLDHVALEEKERHQVCGQWLLTTGMVRYRAAENRSALRMFRRALEHFCACAADFPQAEAQRYCGIMESEARNFLPAIQHLLAALDLYAAKDDRHRRLDVLWSLGVTYVDLGDLQSARHVLHHAEVIARKLRMRPELGKALSKLGDIELREGNYTSALALYEQDLAIAQTYDDPQALAHCHLHLAGAHRYANDSEQVLRHAELACSLFRSCNRELLAAQAELEIATALALLEPKRKSRLAKAEALARTAQQTFAAMSRERGKAEAEFVQGLVEQRRGNLASARALLEQSIARQWQVPPTRLLIEARYRAALVGVQLQDRDYAVEQLRNAVGLAEVLGSRDLRDRCIHELERHSPVSAQRLKLSPYLPFGAVDELSNRWQDIDRERTPRIATIMFADFRGYTAMSGGAAQAELTEAVDTFLRIASRIVIQNGGSVDKFIGDSVLATFGLAGRGREYEPAEAARWAVWSALDLLEELRLTGRVRQALSLGEIRVSVGINTGEVVAGCFGPLSKRDFTVIGYHVNLAARLQSLASEVEHDRANRCLLSGATHEIAQHIVRARKLTAHELQMKGVQNTDAYLVLGRAGEA